MENIGELVSLTLTTVLAIALLVGYVMSIIWVSRDAEARGISGCLVAFLIFMSWPWGLVLWFVLRPRRKTLGD